MHRCNSIRVFIFFSIFFTLYIIAPENSFAESQCIKHRYIFDIGSSATKINAYEIDYCTNKIINKHKEKEFYHYQSCILHSKDSATLSENCINDGIAVLAKIKKKYHIDCDKGKCIGIATSWARNARNISEWQNKIKSLGIKIKILSHDDEAILGFKSMKLAKEIAEGKLTQENIIMFDIGGGSFQIIGLSDNNKEYFYHKGQNGTDTFVKLLVNTFRPNHKYQKDEIVIFNTTELENIIDFSTELIANSFRNDANFAKALNNKISSGNVTLFGNSMLMTYGVRKQMGLNKSIITDEEIRKIAVSFCGLSVEKIEEMYPKLPRNLIFSMQSAMVLVYSIMKNLNMTELHIIDVDASDYLALTLEEDKNFE